VCVYVYVYVCAARRSDCILSFVLLLVTCLIAVLLDRFPVYLLAETLSVDMQLRRLLLAHCRTIPIDCCSALSCELVTS
jgi:hypothetical protein